MSHTRPLFSIESSMVTSRWPVGVQSRVQLDNLSGPVVKFYNPPNSVSVTWLSTNLLSEGDSCNTELVTRALFSSKNDIDKELQI